MIADPRRFWRDRFVTRGISRGGALAGRPIGRDNQRYCARLAHPTQPSRFWELAQKRTDASADDAHAGPDQSEKEPRHGCRDDCRFACPHASPAHPHPRPPRCRRPVGRRRRPGAALRRGCVGREHPGGLRRRLAGLCGLVRRTGRDAPALPARAAVCLPVLTRQDRPAAVNDRPARLRHRPRPPPARLRAADQRRGGEGGPARHPSGARHGQADEDAGDA